MCAAISGCALAAKSRTTKAWPQHKAFCKKEKEMMKMREWRDSNWRGKMLEKLSTCAGYLQRCDL
ncbi:hypothetical protein ACHAXT_010981 [Thalassiosira profunda]